MTPRHSEIQVRKRSAVTRTAVPNKVAKRDHMHGPTVASTVSEITGPSFADLFAGH
jgi:hypothetical protein